ncbi:hypothetical protein E4U38_006665 [Claviceps purpurea]|nr:hypothetical protein E4U38_006665 [Claviceps purpurea]
MPRMFTRASTRATRVPLRAKRASEPHAPPETRQARTPGEQTPTMLEAVQFYDVIHQEACRKYKTEEAKQTVIYKWIASTVNPSLHQSTLKQIRKETGKREVSLRKIAKTLKGSFSPGMMIMTAEISTVYVNHLAEAKLANTHPDKWVEKWYTVYQKAKTYDINEIKGPNAIRDFIHAVGTQFDPTWARAKLVKMIKHNDNLPTDFTLKSIADEFMRYHKATKMFEPSMGIHAALGSRPDTEKAQKSSNKTKKSKF